MIRTLTLRHVDARRIVTLGEVIGAVVLVAVALPTRLVNLEAFAGKFDEGIRGEQLLLMAAGFRPFRDIFASQGPLSLDVFYPTFVLFGQTLGAARLAPALLSIAGLLLAAWTARTLAGPVAAAVTALVLLLSPTYLKNSRLALVEVPALVPAIGAVGAAFAFQRGGDRRWLIASGLLLALALLIKPMVLPAVIPIGLAILLRGDDGVSASLRARLSRALGNGLIVAGTALALAAVVIVAVGPAEVYDQMVRFRMASRQVEGWSLRENWTAISGELVDEGFALHVAALAGGVYLLVTRPRTGLPLAGWAVASFGLLMVYSPIQFKHAVIMLPPLALLVGVAAGECWQAIRRKADDRGLPASRGVIPSGARDDKGMVRDDGESPAGRARFVWPVLHRYAPRRSQPRSTGHLGPVGNPAGALRRRGRADRCPDRAARLHPSRRAVCSIRDTKTCPAPFGRYLDGPHPFSLVGSE